MKQLSKSQLKRLQVQWYQRLKDAGFHDAEHPNGTLKRYDSRIQDKTDPLDASSTQAYYEAARALLHGNYLKGRDRKIWEMHADGVTQDEIADKMACPRTTVRDLIRDVEKRWISRRL